MKVNCNEVQSVFDDLKRITSEFKQTAYAMLRFTRDGIDICYADNNLSFIRSIDGEAEEGDAEFSAIVDIKLYASRLDLFKVSGSIQLKPLSITVDGDSLKLHSVKYFMVAKTGSDGELVWKNDGEVETYDLDGMEVVTRVKFHDVTSNVRFSLTTRTDYEAIKVPDEGTEFHTVETGWFTSLLDKLYKVSDSPVCAVSGKNKFAFAPGKSYLTKVKFDDQDMPSFGLSSLLTGKVVDILRKVEKDSNLRINVTHDRLFTKIVTDDESLAIMVLNTFPSNTSLASLESYETLEYGIARMQFNREMFVNLSRTIVSVVENGTAASKVQFKQTEDGNLRLLVNRKGAGSTEEALQVIAENFTVENMKALEEKVFSIVFKIIDQSLSTFSLPVIEVKIGERGGTKVLRIAEIERNVVTKEMTDEHQMVYMCV